MLNSIRSPGVPPIETDPSLAWPMLTIAGGLMVVVAIGLFRAAPRDE